MSLQVFESILHDSAKMAYYEQNPFLKATFMALYTFKKAGHNFCELGWFTKKADKEIPLKKVA